MFKTSIVAGNIFEYDVVHYIHTTCDNYLHQVSLSFFIKIRVDDISIRYLSKYPVVSSNY